MVEVRVLADDESERVGRSLPLSRLGKPSGDERTRGSIPLLVLTSIVALAAFVLLGAACYNAATLNGGASRIRRSALKRE